MDGSHRWTQLRHLVRMLGRALAGAVALVVALLIPLPAFTPQLFVMAYVPLVVLSFIIYIGKLMLDTFFYDRYER
ncbi:MAG: hypothetical protein WCF84_09930 [Anaerolineae bacterium]